MPKATKAQLEATKRYEDNVYFKALVRFPADLEESIRAAAAAGERSLNNFIVAAVCKAAGLPEPILKEPGSAKASETIRGRELQEPSETTRPSGLQDPVGTIRP